ncbi:serine/threonine protein phosphatase [Candidatus Babeliales bacterium]|nr:serine/threonine protein phosphatase [Candidatus Babeliales bacterium]
MKKLLFLLLFGFSYLQAGTLNQYSTLTQWSAACFEKLPEYDHSCQREAMAPGADLQKIYQTPLTAKQFQQKMHEFVTVSQKELQKKELWIGSNAPQDSLFDVSLDHPNEFEHAYIQKLVIPAQSTVCFMGDYHGSIHSLLRTIWRLAVAGLLDDNFKLRDDVYLIFLGDFVDRGRYGAEVWYTLMQLKLANWNKVHLVRGNHETCGISERFGFLGWGAKKQLGEVCNKFEDQAEKKKFEHGEVGKQILNLYHFLPFALFLSAGHEFVQCCHAGIALNDAGNDFYDVNSFLQSDKIFTKISNKQEGFQWSDFVQELPVWQAPVGWQSGARGSDFGVTADVCAARAYLKKNNLKAFFRGHQDQFFGCKMLFENARDAKKVLDNGAYPNGPYHWQHIVSGIDRYDSRGFLINNYAPIFTFTSASEGQGVPFDCFGLVNVGDGRYENWRLRVCETSLVRERDGKFVSLDLPTDESLGVRSVQDQFIKVQWAISPLAHLQHQVIFEKILQNCSSFDFVRPTGYNLN